MSWIQGGDYRYDVEQAGDVGTSFYIWRAKGPIVKETKAKVGFICYRKEDPPSKMKDGWIASHSEGFNSRTYHKSFEDARDAVIEMDKEYLTKKICACCGDSVRLPAAQRAVRILEEFAEANEIEGRDVMEHYEEFICEKIFRSADLPKEKMFDYITCFGDTLEHQVFCISCALECLNYSDGRIG